MKSNVGTAVHDAKNKHVITDNIRAPLNAE